MFYSAMLLTLVNLLLRFVGTSFQVYISGTLGPSVVGLLQLVLSVGSLAMVAGIGGIRTGAMYLCAEELGRKQTKNLPWVLSGCFAYSICFSLTVAAALYGFAPWIAEHWIGDVRTVAALQLFGAFLPISCLCAVMVGYFTAASRIGQLTAVEVVEQFFSMGVTMVLLRYWAGTNPARACLAVIMGSCLGACLTLVCLLALHLRDRLRPGNPIPIRFRLMEAALPLAVADVAKSGITTTENLMVPKRLSKNPSISDPLAAFGLLSGMVFPVMMFPACILYGLAELLIPELARCAAAGSKGRISYLIRRSLKVSLLYGLFFGGGMYLAAEPLCMALYESPEAGTLLRRYSLLIPMLYCDAITDAMTKGLGQQKVCVRYNILTSALDVVLLYLLLPRYGMEGYFVSFFATHLLNFCLSLRRLVQISGEGLEVRISVLSIFGCVFAVLFSGKLARLGVQLGAFFALYGALLTLFQVVGMEDLRWLRGLVGTKK